MVGDPLVGVEDGGVVATAESLPDRGGSLAGELACEVHGDLPGEGDSGAAIACEAIPVRFTRVRPGESLLAA